MRLSRRFGQIRLNPELPGTHNNLGNALKDQGNLDEAITCFDRAVALAPHNPALLSNRLYSIYFHPRYTSSEILTEHLRWEELVHVRRCDRLSGPARQRS